MVADLVMTADGEEIPAEDARTCAACKAVHDVTGPINYEPTQEACDHWVCDDCQEGLKGMKCRACMEGK